MSYTQLIALAAGHYRTPTGGTATDGPLPNLPDATAFNGTDQYANLDAAVTGIGTTKVWTFAGWVRHRSIVNNVYIMSYGRAGQAAAFVAWFTSTGPNLLRYYSLNDSAAGASDRSMGTPVADVWTHVAMVSDGTNVALYRDGALVSTAAITAATMTLNKLTLGALGRSTYSNHAPVDWCDVAVFDDARTLADIETLFAGPPAEGDTLYRAPCKNPYSRGIYRTPYAR